MGISNNISWKLVQKEILNPDLEIYKVNIGIRNIHFNYGIIEYLKQFKNVAAITECVMQ